MCLWSSSEGSQRAPVILLKRYNDNSVNAARQTHSGAHPLQYGMFTLCSHAKRGMLTTICLSRLSKWDASGARLEQTLSPSADLRFGRAASAEAVHQRLGQRIVLRHKTRVIEEYK